ncbi:RpiB/LacA/LacB family sugar-phosphate isomerase [Patescibacteria group bacterium]|nr:RpiB/LacA/LacB family sugar-phosphate isomerase [Patescibacteria group bacterium]MCL5409879.1 RpiB/LacA/LacB family sugar-phosphate isomerase [Patescibacteria group bacterium]
MIYLGADHRGFELKEKLQQRLEDEGFLVTDLGNNHLDPQDDFVDFAQKVAEAVGSDEQNQGILLCGSGAGVDMVANKISGVRAALVFDEKRAWQARHDDNANILALPADVFDIETVWPVVKTFLTTPFSNEERFERRLKKIEEVENLHEK